MDRGEIIFGLGLAAIVAGAATYIVTDRKRKEVAKLEAEAKLPSEYWEAKKEEAKASIEKNRSDNETKERLKIDERKRADAARRERMEFEKNAPDGYWNQKKIEEEEKTKRQYERDRLEADKYIARKNSEALRDGARSVGHALRTISGA